MKIATRPSTASNAPITIVITAANTTQPTHALEVRRLAAVSVDRSGADAGGISDVLILDSSMASRSVAGPGPVDPDPDGCTGR